MDIVTAELLMSHLSGRGRRGCVSRGRLATSGVAVVEAMQPDRSLMDGADHIFPSPLFSFSFFLDLAFLI